MKKVILAIAASVLGAPVAAAPFDRHVQQVHKTKQSDSFPHAHGARCVLARPAVDTPANDYH